MSHSHHKQTAPGPTSKPASANGSGGARHKAKLTQAALAESAGLTQQYVAKIEAGQINPTLATMAAVARVLDMEIGDMLRLAGPPTK
jgi:transcriptional regulator with XRE-family HTH domain